MGSEIKDTNPKDAIGISKMPLSCLPLPVLGEMAIGMMEGALKYGRHNYRDSSVRASVYIDAAFRHLALWWEGEDDDPDSGLNHITKILTTLTVLRDGMMQQTYIDDRPPPAKKDWMKKQNEYAANLIVKYPDPIPAHLASTPNNPGEVYKQCDNPNCTQQTIYKYCGSHD